HRSADPRRGRPVREPRSRGANRDTSHTHAPSPEGPGSRLDVHHLPREPPANVKSPPRQVTSGHACAKPPSRSLPGCLKPLLFADEPLLRWSHRPQPMSGPPPTPTETSRSRSPQGTHRPAVPVASHRGRKERTEHHGQAQHPPRHGPRP